ncbi:Molybdenum cofactor sulfurase [Apostasia shenzhenica]|uniref:Molybdenum cofactor sulfurase n=1 Tax=Apostasia shenzhenica TaxID=1088818 RepID=A0A2I0B1M7_9ASPA|nr:Molybdenum cofactor sulfurase [Apostasia shenzhenica]
MLELIHENESKVCVLYGRNVEEAHLFSMGATITFNLKRSDASWFGYKEVEQLASLSSIQLRALPFQVSESPGSQGNFKAFVFKLIDYNSVLKILKKLMVVELQYIPYTTLLAIRTFHDYAIAGLIPCWKEQYSEGQVDDMFERMPRSLRDALLPFQLEGVRFGLRRGARCLIADEMGLWKTLQAIAIASCFRNEGPILIVCAAVLRFSWAEELEHWLPFLVPKDIHLDDAASKSPWKSYRNGEQSQKSDLDDSLGFGVATPLLKSLMSQSQNIEDHCDIIVRKVSSDFKGVLSELGTDQE